MKSFSKRVSADKSSKDVLFMNVAHRICDMETRIVGVAPHWHSKASYGGWGGGKRWRYWLIGIILETVKGCQGKKQGWAHLEPTSFRTESPKALGSGIKPSG